MAQPPHKLWLRSNRPRALQCCAGVSVKRTPPSSVASHQSSSVTVSMPSPVNQGFNPSGTKNRSVPPLRACSWRTLSTSRWS